MYRVLSFWDRVCIDIHDVFVYRVPNSGSHSSLQGSAEPLTALTELH